MSATEERIRNDLESRDTDRIECALGELTFALESFEELRAPWPASLIDEPLSQDAREQLFRLLDEYESFEPVPSSARRFTALALLAIVSADDELALEATLALKADADPARRVAEVLGSIAARGAARGRGTRGRPVSQLLARRTGRVASRHVARDQTVDRRSLARGSRLRCAGVGRVRTCGSGQRSGMTAAFANGGDGAVDVQHVAAAALHCGAQRLDGPVAADPA